MSADATRRLARLREVLPSVYDTRPGPGESLLGTMLLRVAEELAGMDEAQRRALHDRWLPLACGTAPDSGVLPALDRLGALLGTPRLTAAGKTEGLTAAGGTEDSEAYRARIATTGHALTGGMATPRALLALALAAVGAEICPKLQTHHAARGADDPWVVEATAAHGLPRAARRRCPACDNPAAPCPLAGQAVAAADLIENPVTRRQHQAEAAYWQPFAVESRSLTTDRPVIRLTPLAGRTLTNPAVQNCATGETLLFEGAVRPGETLVLWPGLAEEELRPFDSIDPDAHHPWARGGLSGRAMLGEHDVSAAVFFMSGSRFEAPDSVYAKAAGNPPDPAELGTRFAVMEQAVRTPRLRPAADQWRLLQFAEIKTAATEGTDKEKARAARENELFAALAKAEDAAKGEHKDDPPVAMLDIDWLVRPPATVRLCLWRSPQVEAAQGLGAIALLQRDLELVRPAGVQVQFEIRERPLPRELAAPGENPLRVHTTGRWREAATPADRPPRMQLGLALPAERHEVADRAPAWTGVFDSTAFDASRLN